MANRERNMPGPEDIIRQTADDLKGRKARVRSISAKPEGTRKSPLPPAVNKALEAQFGADLGKVRVHTGGNAPDLAKELGAKAFTIGNDICFARPGDTTDPETLAHQMTFVVQHGGGRIPKEKDGKALTSK